MNSFPKVVVAPLIHHLKAGKMFGRMFLAGVLSLFLVMTFSGPGLSQEPTAAPLEKGSKPLKALWDKFKPDEAGSGTGEDFPGEQWAVWEDPGARGWIPAGLAAAEKLFLSQGGTGLMLIDEGRVAAQWGDVSRPVNCHSVRKSFLGALYGIEVSKGTIKLSDTLAELGIDDRGGLSPAEKKARIVDLLLARSGVYHPAAYETKAMQDKRPERGSHGPGQFYYYNNWDFNALGTIYRQTTGRDIFQAFDEDIARPIGMQDFRPEDCRYHLESVSDHPAYIFNMSVRDRARFGLLFLRQGKWKDRRVIPAKWVQESTTSYSQAGKGIGYGYLWWVSTGSYHLTNKVRGKAFSARGHWGQYIVVLPGHGLVVAMANDKSAGAPRLKNRHIGAVLKMILRSNKNYLTTMAAP